MRYIIADVSRYGDDYALDHIFGMAASKNIFFTTPAFPWENMNDKQKLMRCKSTNGN